MKKLPNIDIETAARIWEAQNLGTFNHENFRPYFTNESPEIEEFNDSDLLDIQFALSEIQAKYEDIDIKRQGGYVDAEIVEPIHSFLRPYASVYELSQPGFRMWLSNSALDGFFWEFIKWRFGVEAQKINWGITQSVNYLIEGYFARAWLRGQKMFDASLNDPYKYASMGLSDLWRSHILRTEFGKDREFVKAFLDFIFDNNIKNDDIRKVLIPAIRAWTASATFSHLDYEECKTILHTIMKV